MTSAYTSKDLVEAFRAVGVRSGDVVFTHSNIGYFGFPKEGRSPAAVFQAFLRAFQEAIGDGGTLVAPTFTYSFCKGQAFDPELTPSVCGVFTEMLRRHPAALRSCDPIFSVAALGPRAADLVSNVPPECFGTGSFWDRLWETDGLICNLNLDAGSTYIHYVEKRLCVPYRYDKLFPGVIARHGKKRDAHAVFFCQDSSNPLTAAAFEPFDQLARKRGLVRSASVGRGAVVAIRARDVLRLLESELPRRPWLLTEAEKTRAVPLLLRPPTAAVALTPRSSLEETFQELSRVNREMLSQAFGAALDAIGTHLPLTVHSFPTGARCASAIIPEQWECTEARLETADRRTVFSMEDHRLHVARYSLPFEGEVSQQELFDHLYVADDVPAAIPQQLLHPQRKWGLCCSSETKRALTLARYRAIVRATFRFGELKVGEGIARGIHDDSILLAAPLSGVETASQGLSGAVVGVQVMTQLQRRPRLRNTYRLLLVPERFGLPAFLSRYASHLPIQGIIWLDRLLYAGPHVLTYAGPAAAPLNAAASAARHGEAGASYHSYEYVSTEDLSGPAPALLPALPLCMLTRQPLQPEERNWAGTSLDSGDRLDFASLSASASVVLSLVDALEKASLSAALRSA